MVAERPIFGMRKIGLERSALDFLRSASIIRRLKELENVDLIIGERKEENSEYSF